MDGSVIRNIRVSDTKNLPLKKCWSVGTRWVVGIDDTIVQRLGITDDTIVEEEITPDGILLKIRRIGE